MSEFSIVGPAGDLEAIWSDTGGHVAAVLCHPHPQYGGSMHDMVLAAVERACSDAGISSLRFNFRGVGRSAGDYDEGVGEVDDVCAAVEWVRQNESVDHVKLVGYSFGGAVALAAADRVAADDLIFVAPAVGLFGELPVPTLGNLVVIGDSDQFVSVEGVTDFFPQEMSKIEILPGVDHFFMGAHDDLTNVVAAYL